MTSINNRRESGQASVEYVLLAVALLLAFSMLSLAFNKNWVDVFSDVVSQKLLAQTLFLKLPI